MALGLTQPLTEMSTRNISWEVKGGRCVRLTALPLSCASTSWNAQCLFRPVMGLLTFRRYLSIFRRIFLFFRHYATQEDRSADRKGQLFRKAIYLVSSPGGLELESTVKQNYVLANWKTCGNNTARTSELRRSLFIFQLVRFLSFSVRTKFALFNDSLPHSLFITVIMKNLTGALRKLLNSPLCPRGRERTERSVCLHLASFL
jgi:hypothetical protein